MIGAAISGRSHSVVSNGNDSKDGEMICRVLQLIRVTGSSQSQHRFSKTIEMAYLWFLHQFRKPYLSDNSANSADVCEQISRSLDLPEGNSVLYVVLDKVLYNLKTFIGHEDLILQSIELLKGMSMGYKASKTLLSLPRMQYVVANHSLDQFFALSRNGDSEALRLRTALYETLVSMVSYISDEELSDRLKQFLRPFTGTKVIESQMSCKALDYRERFPFILTLLFSTRISFLIFCIIFLLYAARRYHV
ncbi:hypothetical protein M513_14098 [Trichuris suis]|uniref:Exportin-7/Ran-binding protein 17 TPR repeats domain-containing protein n=1 Tax=Trichuris suis TaxID=68888 RepID=A0A085LJ79_9BILA|nr:hypothetical protein M513_14098 [Trichuris suis]